MKKQRLPKKEIILWFGNRLLLWYRSSGRQFPWRRKNISNYKYIIAELLLQRTRAETVARYIFPFMEKYPSWKSIDNCEINVLSRDLVPFGLWRRRSIAMKALAHEIVLRNGRFPRDRDDIETLPGVGQYIANAILLFSYDMHEPLLDTNMARVLERFFGPRILRDIRYDPYLQSLSRRVVDREKSRELNWAILDLAAVQCKIKSAKCSTCPIGKRCNYFVFHSKTPF